MKYMYPYKGKTYMVGRSEAEAKVNIELVKKGEYPAIDETKAETKKEHQKKTKK